MSDKKKSKKVYESETESESEYITSKPLERLPRKPKQLTPEQAEKEIKRKQGEAKEAERRKAIARRRISLKLDFMRNKRRRLENAKGFKAIAGQTYSTPIYISGNTDGEHQDFIYEDRASIVITDDGRGFGVSLNSPIKLPEGYRCVLYINCPSELNNLNINDLILRPINMKYRPSLTKKTEDTRINVNRSINKDGIVSQLATPLQASSLLCVRIVSRDFEYIEGNTIESGGLFNIFINVDEEEEEYDDDYLELLEDAENLGLLDNHDERMIN